MNRFLMNGVMWLGVAMLLMCGCNSGDTSEKTLSKNSRSVQPDDEMQNAKSSSWPTDAIGLVQHLNDWHHDELVAYNEPEKFPRFKTSGETNGWIAVHEEALAKLGVKVRWDHEQQKYVRCDAQ